MSGSRTLLVIFAKKCQLENRRKMADKKRDLDTRRLDPALRSLDKRDTR